MANKVETTGAMAFVKLALRLPTVPNYILTEAQPVKGDIKFEVGDLSDDELRSIGAAWTEKLLERARTQRSIPKSASDAA